MECYLTETEVSHDCFFSCEWNLTWMSSLPGILCTLLGAEILRGGKKKTKCTFWRTIMILAMRAPIWAPLVRTDSGDTFICVHLRHIFTWRCATSHMTQTDQSGSIIRAR